MTDTTAVVDFLLGKMTQQLISSDDQLILEAFEKKLIDKDQIQLFYEDMQFLRKFLKDSSGEMGNKQLKRLVSKIRVVTCQVDDTMDSLVLNAVLHKHTRVFANVLVLSLSRTMADLAEKIYDRYKTITREIDFVKDFRTLAITLLSSIESQLVAEKINVDCFRDIIEDIKRTKMDVMRSSELETDWKKPLQKEMRKRLIITWLESDMPDEFRFLFKLSEMMLYRTKRIRELFSSLIGEINEDMTKQLSTTWPEFDIAGDIHLLVSLSQETADMVKGISYVLFTPSTVIQRTKKKVMTIYEKASSVTSLDSQMADEFLGRFNFFEQTFVEYLLCDPSVNFVSTKREMMNIYERNLSLPWLDWWATVIRGCFGSVTEDIKSIKTEVKEIYDKQLYGMTGIPRSRKFSHGTLPKPIRPIVHEEIVVGLDEETRAIKELLTEEHQKQLKCISIIGMPGLGKTTLAKKVYNDSFIEYHFYIRAWIYVSQVYQKKDLLLAILSSAFQSRDYICETHDKILGADLYRLLKGKRYLIVMDDIWNSEPLKDLKIYLPNDNNGSRILFTTRHENVAVAFHAKPHHLRFLNEDESWDLLRLKTFRKESCPLELMEIGKQIARKCRGLPLAIVAISGLLAKQDKTLERWKHVAESVSSYMVSDPEQYMHTLELSYNVLPYYLKACFLYLGAFTEYEIPVQKLIWLWVAEGFIWQNEQKTLEEVAEDYLMDLIDRSLVIVSKKRSNGEIKACCVHDLMRDLCLRKAQEHNFLHQISLKGQKENLLKKISDKVQEGKFFEQIFGKPQEENLQQQIFEKVQEGNIFQQIFGSSSSSLSIILNKHRRMCIHPELANFSSLQHYPFTSKVCSILSFGRSNSWGNLFVNDVSFVYQNFILLRVLDLSSIQISFFPERITQLVLLRYLALHVAQQKIFLPAKFNLLNLETLILEGPIGSLVLSDDIWKIVKLRHLKAKRLIEFTSIPNDGRAFLLGNLQTVGKLHLYSGEERALKWTPNLKKLKCHIRKRLNGEDHFPKLDFLIHLETLNVISSDCKRFFHLDNFPPSLRSLTLSHVGLRWEEMSTLEMLPNLEVLKLYYNAFKGPRWDTCDGEFCKLRFLKFQALDIGQWNTSSNHFPHLQKLVLESCARLEEIPSSLGDISTLEMIQLRLCCCSAENSAREIQEHQRSMGNDGLKVQILARRRNHETMISEHLASI
ncbi:late blight resistance protein R1-A-like [Cornus florida]|uniref:late blight resistance protein R1-A-like n=1 Tax=Cornus florida TaxID=4283 RepID=UPI0028A076BF|nr:late blight resistance protein R1-A-like [Cornus florida]XP_059649743.1 late blight resistance protein R1-A-like [Cornus florida]XP_059649744.1 late blight resistance protein R1-A-like [Cornus florida]XP_059649745.1 late blight resistance protein R1-A-like [Cornus florida]XP_059649746.1 late blight resistance protein R1-A-like [Cornus florida]XP_059649747.1 late blight resistance protein R1-A-like [Cornus florida]XP_059649748.1 late blight resistance protein R1-A-like [Cornus florida]